MGIPLSPVVANVCMVVVKDSALPTTTVAAKIWKRFFDDNFVNIKRESVSTLHETLNPTDPKISFTNETKNNNGRIAFLNSLVSRNNCIVSTGVYRKSTQTDRYLDFSSYHVKKHKIRAFRAQ